MTPITELEKVRNNRFWDDGEHYWLELTSGKKTAFDRDENILSSLQAFIKVQGGFGGDMQNSKTKLRLPQLLYSMYHKKPTEWMRGGHVRILNKNYSDMTSGNLIHTSAYNENNTNRNVKRDGDIIIFTHKKSGKAYLTGYEPGLFELLCSPKLNRWRLQNNRLHAFFVVGKNGKRGCVSLYELIYAYYHCGARADDFIKPIQDLKREFSEKNMTLDHCDCQQQNCFIWNLSIMTRLQNMRKGSLVAKVLIPFYCFPVYDGKAYRIFAGFFEKDGMMWGNCFICENADSLIDFLKSYVSSDIDGTTPKGFWRNSKNGVCLAHRYGDFAISEREKLLAMDVSEFSVWNPKPHAAE